MSEYSFACCACLLDFYLPSFCLPGSFCACCLSLQGPAKQKEQDDKYHVSDTLNATTYQQPLPCIISRTVYPSLSKNATARLVLSTVISRLDYCNATFTGISSEQMLRLQRILNHATRLVMKRSKHDHITPLLKELHWLPVQFRSQYKLATLAYRHFDGSLPQCLSSCLCTYEPSRTLWSSHEKLLKIPKCNLKTFGQHSFSFFAPTV